ncbi:MAG TPA: hypothetical protein VGM37_07180 [Armatimonadota bacterium]|jgi:hypothetical protein
MRPVASAIAALAILGLSVSLTVEVAAVFGRPLIHPRPASLAVGAAMALLPLVYGYLRPREPLTPRDLSGRLGELPIAMQVLLGAAWACGFVGVTWLAVDLYISGPNFPAASVARSCAAGWAMFFAGTAVHALARSIAPRR